MTLNHVHLGTRDIKKSVEFYSSIFGFRKKFDHGQGNFLVTTEGFSAQRATGIGGVDAG